MAHFAEIDEDGIVLRVCVVNDDYEADGENWCANFWGGTWKQTSYNNNIRKQFASIGGTYDAAKDKFIAPQPFPSWVLNSEDDWKSPVEYPDDGKFYTWNETDKKWEEV